MNCNGCAPPVTSASCEYCGYTENTCTAAECSACGSSGGYARDTAHCAGAAGTVVGNGGAGPTTWASYYPFGLGGVTYNQARTITATRDGTPDGHVQTQFVDGLGRDVEHCSEVDPAMSSNNAAVCSTTLYDNMSHPYQTYTPFFTPAMPMTVVNAPTTDQYIEKHYDALDRIISTQLMVNGVGQLPATTTTFSGYAAQSGYPTRTVAQTTDANGYISNAVVDFLGRTIEVDVQSSSCGNGYCQTKSVFDAAGRLGTIIDPAGNVSTFLFDGLDRTTQTSDPDRGVWSFVHDNNGNLTQQTDARGAVTYIHYDVLNRQTLRDLPYLKNGTTWVAGTPGEEDEFIYWDSAANLPATCYSCDDHCSTTTADTCNVATLACTHTGTPCTNPDQ
jgi:YD repeat-containing protein